VSALSVAVASTTGWNLAARVDLLRGDIVERCAATGGSGIAAEDDLLFAAIEMLRSHDKPRQIMVLTEHHVHLYERSSTTPHVALVLVAGREQNLGFLLANLRSIQALVGT
jgi:hypothetical protein